MFPTSLAALALLLVAEAGASAQQLPRCGHIRDCISKEMDLHPAGQLRFDPCFRLMQRSLCLQDYAIRCLRGKDSAKQKRIFSGVAAVTQHLCGDGSYRSLMMRYAGCSYRAARDVQRCTRLKDKVVSVFASRKDLYREETVPTSLRCEACCALRAMTNCSVEVTRKNCGNVTAEFSRHLYETMTSPVYADCAQCFPNATACATWQEEAERIIDSDSEGMTTFVYTPHLPM